MKRGLCLLVVAIQSIAFILPLYIAYAEEESLTWQDCIAEASKNNPDLISAVENVNQQKASKSITASGLYPQIDADAGASGKKTKSPGSSATSTKTYSYGVSGSQLIFDGFKTVNEVHSAAETVKAAQQDYRFTSAQVRLDLRTAFVNLLTAQELIRVSKGIEKIRRDNLELITLRYLCGLEHKGALMTAEANLSDAASGLARAERDVVIAQRKLTKAMGRGEFKPMIAQGDFTVVDTGEEKPDLDALARMNPSVMEAIAKRNAASFDLKSAYGNFAPQVSGTAGASRSDSGWPPRNDELDIGASVTLPIFEGGLRTAQVAQAKAAYNQAVQNERSLRDTAVVNLEKTWAALQDAIEQVVVQFKTLEAANERARIAQAQYSVGFINFDDWIIIENDLVRAKKTYLEVQSTALLSEADWINAKGETLEYAP